MISFHHHYHYQPFSLATINCYQASQPFQLANNHYCYDSHYHYHYHQSLLTIIIYHSYPLLFALAVSHYYLLSTVTTVTISHFQPLPLAMIITINHFLSTIVIINYEPLAINHC